MLTHVLQLFVLVLRDLRHKERERVSLDGSRGFWSGPSEVRRVPTHLQSLLQELHASLLPVGELVREAPVSDQENQGLRRTRNHSECNSGTILTNVPDRGNPSAFHIQEKMRNGTWKGLRNVSSMASLPYSVKSCNDHMTHRL